MSSSESNPNCSDRDLNAAIAEYYRQVEGGIGVDRQAFVRQYPGLESELSDFLSNLGVFGVDHDREDSHRRDSSQRISSVLPGNETRSLSRVGRGGSAVQEVVMLRDYRILELIGQGGMGSVYRAMHVRLQKQVALKTLKLERVNSPEAIQRFTREMRLLAKLEHANIVQALDAGEHDGINYFVMELVAGINLSQLVARLGPLPIPEASRTICLAAEALQYAHDQKILHRDVKPSNLMITAKGSVKLLDLGLAHIFEMQLEDQISRMDQAVGTLAYMAPEQLANSQQCSNQSDVFSLGISLHELLSGKRPCYQAGGLALVADVRSIRPDLDPELGQLLDQMIAPSPGDRPQSMAEVVARLNVFATNADLSGLVAEYYRWNTRGALVPTPPPICDDTEENSARKRRTSDVTSDANTSDQKAILFGVGPSRWRAILSFLAGAAIVAGIAFFSAEKPQKAEPPPPTFTKVTGVLEIVSDTDDEFTQKIIANGNLRVKALKEGDQNVQPLGVNEGLNDLEPGKYELHIPGPVDFEPIPFEIIGSAITRLLPTPLVRNNFQNPVIPDAGSRAKYHGQIWLKNWSTKAHTNYVLTLEVLSVDDQDARRTKWLKVEVRSNLETGIYQEVAYLQLDSDEWDNRRMLSFEDGWVEASGESIKQLLNDRLPESGSETLVVKFDPAKDVLKEISSFTLPEGRVSVHDILVLFFGDNRIAGANEFITMLRASLSENEDRHVSLPRIQLSRGIFECYVVSSRSHEEDKSAVGWSIARTREIPFEIARMEVNSPILIATCSDEDYSDKADTDPAKLSQILAYLATREIDPAKLPKPHPRNLATIPNLPSSITVGGTINRGSLPENIQFTARMLGTEVIDRKSLHWLEFDLTIDPAGERYREIARLLVDASEYPGGPLKIERGWFAFDDGTTVLPLPKDHNLDPIINARLQVSAEPHFKNTGIVDLMSMFFNTDCDASSRLADSRRKLDGLINTRPIGKPVHWPHNKLGVLHCNLYETTDAEPIAYKFYRCNQVPFGFAEIKIGVSNQLSIHLGLENYQLLGEPFETSPLGSKEHLASLELATSQRLAARAQINWRVWTWEDSGKTHKVWAEFGGTVESTKSVRKEVLLWDEFKNERRIPLALFVPADRRWIDQGRVWQTTSPEPLVLLGFDTTSLKFGRWHEGQNMVFPLRNPVSLERLTPEDKSWFIRHKSSKVNSKTDEWNGFARYVR